jgi:hypothetical protein
MVVKLSTDKTVSIAADALQDAVQANQLGVMQETMRRVCRTIMMQMQNKMSELKTKK